MTRLTWIEITASRGALLALALTAPAQLPAAENADSVRSVYALGPDDQITLRALDADEITDKPFRINPSGFITLPLLGRVHAAGLTSEQLEAELTKRLKAYVQDPHVSVNVTEFRSQPVSVIGAVKLPGVVQLQGRKTLLEMLSLAGGLREDAGYSAKITRSVDWGSIPLPDARIDSTSKFTVGEVPLKEILDGRRPEKNILIRPNDVISVPRAEIVYVIGEVAKAGGFVLDQRQSLTVLQALSLAGGMNRTAAAHRARVLRTANGTDAREEIPLNVKKILAGKATDFPLRPDDILFIPNSTGKFVALSTLESAIRMAGQVGAGVAIYGR
jgi:polysaccharide export outer membrane protein